jgi:mannose-6-phosphate isomerase-like protein (cupin superfamily)
MSRGYVVAHADVAARDRGGVEERVTIDASCGCERLEQRVLTLAPGRSDGRATGDRQELLYVAAGRGKLYLDGKSYELVPDTGVFLVPGDTFSIETEGNDQLVVVAVSAPCVAQERSQVTVRYADRESLPATPNREFRFLVNEDFGCLEVTQFVGTIPPGRAPLHSHPYDEVVYVVEGEGVVHLAGRDTPIGPGSCIHLPSLREHCLENTGPTPMRVLGVFHPSGSPASKTYEANE